MYPMLTIAFIDDGISPEFVPEDIPFENIVANEDGVQPGDTEHVVSHGTMCYQIFKNNVNVPYRLISIKALDNTVGTGNHKALLAALDWCAGQDIDIINMSMGTRQYTDFAPIASAISRLSNTVIIAACSNQNELTFPACLPTVIGVRHCGCEGLWGKYAFAHNPYDQIDVMTCVKEMPISFGNGHVVNLSGTNSFAAPLISARICDYIAQGCRGLNAIRQRLCEDAVTDTALDYSFYKGLLGRWETLTIPIVGVVDDGSTLTKLMPLIAEFVDNGYRAIALTTTKKTSAADFVYRLEWYGAEQVDISDLINMYYNFALPDIIFLHMGLDDLAALPHEVMADVVLKPTDINGSVYTHWDKKFVLDIDNEDLLNNIEKLLA